MRPPTVFCIKDVRTGLQRNNGSYRVLRCLKLDPITRQIGQLVLQTRSERASYREIETEFRLFPTATNPNSI